MYRNGLFLVSTPNDAAHRDTVERAGTFTYRVCQPGTTYCSNPATVTF